MDTIATEDEELMELYLGGEEVSQDQIKAAIRKGTIDNVFVPILCGSAFKNKGVQPMLDAVIDFLPSPIDVPPIKGTDAKGENEITRDANDPSFAALGVQDRRRPVRQVDVLPGVLGLDQQGRRGLQLHQGAQRAPRPHPVDARQPA